MASRTLVLHCDNSIREILSRAIREYAHAAYPEGGSECAQVARYTLLNVAAMDYHFDLIDAASGHGSAAQRELFAGLLKGEAITVGDLDAARAADVSEGLDKSGS